MPRRAEQNDMDNTVEKKGHGAGITPLIQFFRCMGQHHLRLSDAVRHIGGDRQYTVTAGDLRCHQGTLSGDMLTHIIVGRAAQRVAAKLAAHHFQTDVAAADRLRQKAHLLTAVDPRHQFLGYIRVRAFLRRGGYQNRSVPRRIRDAISQQHDKQLPLI